VNVLTQDTCVCVYVSVNVPDQDAHPCVCMSYVPYQDAAAMIRLAEERGVELLLPCDVRVSYSLDQPLDLALSDLTTTCCSPDKPCLPKGALLSGSGGGGGSTPGLSVVGICT
jgi:hypothetical protein